MREKDVKLYIKKYASYMEEIKKRKNVVSRLHKSYLSNQSMTGYIETDIDTVYLQLRKIIELVMFACVVANDSAGLTLNKTLKKGYEIKKIKNELKRFNSDFFPSPMAEGGIDENGIRKVDDLDPSDQEFLTEEELFKVYGKAGKFLHSQREYQYGSPEEKIKILNEGIDYINKLVVLLNHHWTKITNDTFFAVVMQDENDGKVHVARMARFDGGHT